MDQELGVSKSKSRKEWVLGIFFIVLVAVIWAAASVWVQFIYEKLDFESPFLLTYVCTSLFSLFLPFRWTGMLFGWVKPLPWGDSKKAGTAYSNLGDGSKISGLFNENTENQPLLLPDSRSPQSSEVNPLPGAQALTHKQTLKLSLILSPLWFLANWPYNASLLLTSVTSSTVISTTSSLFTFLLSVILSLEKFSIQTCLGVILCMAGTILVAYSDKKAAGRDSFWGDLVCLLAAVMYASYTTVLRLKVPNDEAASMPLVFGYIGVINAVLILPLVIVMGFYWPDTISTMSWELFGCFVVKGLFDNVLSDYFWARAVVLTTPTVATVGLSLTIPLAFISDAILGKGIRNFLSVSGAAGVVVGFLLVSTPPTFMTNACRGCFSK